ncbi:terminase [Pseudomonas sp. PSKL.D1]|uniref:terminase n=1 Tax=Pseudomonas sp. PSKL.D1 TaxID=3029060 RepID=UPI002380E0DF|nr:terminase [Pseudomonas sp. PSKL.D1]WDY60383.1 terminase [Pseudomonas sp. PSKL.D1]
MKTAKALAKLGATNPEMAEAFGVSLSTLKLWVVQHAEFSAAIKLGKDVADERVVDALYNRAMGYSHEDTDVRVVDGAVVLTPLMKHYPPDTGAAIFWLKNRRPDEWRDKQEIEHSGNIALTDRILAARKRAKPED